MVLTSSHNYYFKITNELQNSHHSELPKIKLNGSVTTVELKKKTH